MVNKLKLIQQGGFVLLRSNNFGVLPNWINNLCFLRVEALMKEG